MPSQYNEHVEILRHFEGRDPATLRFLDIGAFDGTTFSNTKPLADLGWSGVCLEPSPPAFCHLMKAYADNPRVTLVNAAIVGPNQHRLMKFHCNTVDASSADMMSTFSAEHRAKFGAYPFREIVIPAITVMELVIDGLSNENRFDFINIDVEGLNLDVLRSVGEFFNAEMVCVELDPPDAAPAFGLCLHEMGMDYIWTIGGNLLGWKS